MKVGMAVMLYVWAMSFWLSVLTFVKVM